jgi:hypothetical protein
MPWMYQVASLLCEMKSCQYVETLPPVALAFG